LFIGQVSIVPDDVAAIAKEVAALSASCQVGQEAMQPLHPSGIETLQQLHNIHQQAGAAGSCVPVTH